MRSESVSAGAEKREIRIKRLTADGRGDNMMSNLKPLKGRKRVTDSERVGGGVMPAETEPDNMGPRGPRRKATSSRGRNARVRSLTVMAVDEWVRQQCRVNAGWHRRIRILSRQQVLLSGFLFVGKTKLETTCPCRFGRCPENGAKHGACSDEIRVRVRRDTSPRGEIKDGGNPYEQNKRNPLQNLSDRKRVA